MAPEIPARPIWLTETWKSRHSISAEGGPHYIDKDADIGLPAGGYDTHFFVM
jgi:hypothetical protein